MRENKQKIIERWSRKTL